MAQELSSNWKKLQDRIKAESSTSSKTSLKRKADDSNTNSREGLPSRLAKKQKRPGGQVDESHQPKKRNGISSSSTTLKTQRSIEERDSTKRSMGTTQSSALVKGTPATITPSLALWAEDNHISPEDLAEAYNLGLRKLPLKDNTIHIPTTREDKARVNEGLASTADDSLLGKYVALDCEMVGVGPEGRNDSLARVSLVDFHGRQVYDSYVLQREHVTDWRTTITGISARLLRSCTPPSRSFEEVQRTVADLIKGRVLVGHDLRHDLSALMLSHPTSHTRDTARFSGYKRYGHGPKPALRILAREVLGTEIQVGHHSSIEDARVAMLLFRKKKPEFDVEHANKYGVSQAGRDDTATTEQQQRASKTKKKKKKKKH